MAYWREQGLGVGGEAEASSSSSSSSLALRSFLNSAGFGHLHNGWKPGAHGCGGIQGVAHLAQGRPGLPCAGDRPGAPHSEAAPAAWCDRFITVEGFFLYEMYIVGFLEI